MFLPSRNKGTFMTDTLLANTVCILKISAKRLYWTLLTKVKIETIF